MYNLKSIVLLSLSASLLLAAPTKNKELQQVEKIGHKSSKLLLFTLGKNMKKHMKKGGALDALNFCSNEAYSLTQQVNTKLPKGVQVKRISLRYRSPANVASEQERAVLESLETLKDAGVILPQNIVQKTGEHTYKFYKPLFISKPVCLKCHGDVQNTQLKNAILEKYPLDKAMGYNLGDLRGAIVVDIDKSAK